MNKKTRYFLVGSGLVVAVGLCTGLVAYYSGQISGPAAGPAELAYLPADASVVAFADVDGIMSSEFRQRLREFLPEGPERNRMLEETGIDIERDIDTVVAAVAGRGSDWPDAVVLMRGRFDAGRIESLVTEHGAVVREYAGQRLLVGPSVHGTVDDDGDDQASGTMMPAMVFLESDLVALGPAAALERVIDVVGSGANVTGNTPLMNFLAEIEPTGNAWVVGQFEGLADSPVIPGEVRSHLPGVEWFAASAQIDRGLAGFVRADTADLEAAENLRQVIAGALAMARLAGGENPGVDLALRSVQSSGEGNTVQVSFTIEPELIDLLRQLAPADDGPARTVEMAR